MAGKARLTQNTNKHTSLVYKKDTNNNNNNNSNKAQPAQTPVTSDSFRFGPEFKNGLPS